MKRTLVDDGFTESVQGEYGESSCLERRRLA